MIEDVSQVTLMVVKPENAVPYDPQVEYSLCFLIHDGRGMREYTEDFLSHRAMICATMRYYDSTQWDSADAAWIHAIGYTRDPVSALHFLVLAASNKDEYLEMLTYEFEQWRKGDINSILHRSPALREYEHSDWVRFWDTVREQLELAGIDRAAEFTWRKSDSS